MNMFCKTAINISLAVLVLFIFGCDPNDDGLGTSTEVTAEFSSNFSVIDAGGTIDFSDKSTGDPHEWVWDFEGGAPAAFHGQHPPPITYNYPGVYKVQLKVNGIAATDTEIKESFITVETEDIITLCYDEPGQSGEGNVTCHEFNDGNGNTGIDLLYLGPYEGIHYTSWLLAWYYKNPTTSSTEIGFSIQITIEGERVEIVPVGKYVQTDYDLPINTNGFGYLGDFVSVTRFFDLEPEFVDLVTAGHDSPTYFVEVTSSTLDFIEGNYRVLSNGDSSTEVLEMEGDFYLLHYK
jgi:PKD repeat protein